MEFGMSHCTMLRALGYHAQQYTCMAFVLELAYFKQRFKQDYDLHFGAVWKHGRALGLN